VLPLAIEVAVILAIAAPRRNYAVRKRVPPEAYFPIIDAYVSSHEDALIFLATDDIRYYQRVADKYGTTGRLVSQGVGYETRHVVLDRRLFGGSKGDSVLIDALLLAHTDFLLKTTSAVAEFALWVQPHLHEHHLDLQVMDRFKSQKLPKWIDDSVIRDFCKGLELGCAIESNQTGRGSEKFCERCMPVTQAPSPTRSFFWG